jgi:hypothetical protein
LALPYHEAGEQGIGPGGERREALRLQVRVGRAGPVKVEHRTSPQKRKVAQRLDMAGVAACDPQ